MKEVVCIHVGQCGVQLSNAAWELLCIEHGIRADGLRKDLTNTENFAFTTFFQEVPGCQFVPRVISVDLEPTVIDEVRTGAYRNLFHPDQLISGFEDAANNFARGHFTTGERLIQPVLSQVRRAVERCEYLQNFFIFNSYGGGSGSGFTSLLLERLAIEFTNRYRVQITVSTSPVLTTSVVEPYNAALTVHSSMEQTNLSILTDNEASYRICNVSLDIPRPTYANLNRLISQVFSDITASIRFESSLSNDMDQLTTNLVPYPRIHFPVMSHAPNISKSRAEHQQLSISEITRSVFSKDCLLVSCNPQNSKYMSCCLQYRGAITPTEVNSTTYELKKRSDLNFVVWCPTGFKIGINNQPPATVPGSEMAQINRSVSLLTSTSALNESWINLRRKFELIFKKRAFVHWYVSEGMEEGEMNEAMNDITLLIADYEEVSADDAEYSLNLDNEYAMERENKKSLNIVTDSDLLNSVSKSEKKKHKNKEIKKEASSDIESELKSRSQDGSEDESEDESQDESQDESEDESEDDTEDETED